ncbi:MAG: hypothetical protein IKG42_05175 [Clostridia bacterium]|nr:hypothetical protein [Clostridia bacterium]
MLDTTAWGVKFKNSNNSSYINYVTGGPTIEQFATSYNTVHTTTADQIFYSETGNTGYYVKKGQAPTIETYDIFSTADNNLYFITSTSKANAAWIASPSANNDNYVIFADYSGYMYFSASSNIGSMGFRPLVSLKSGVSLVDSDSDGVYDFN